MDAEIPHHQHDGEGSARDKLRRTDDGSYHSRENDDEEADEVQAQPQDPDLVPDPYPTALRLWGMVLGTPRRVLHLRSLPLGGHGW